MSRVLNAMSRGTVRTENGALSNATTGFAQGSSCLDYFFKAGTYGGRDQATVDADMYSIFADDEKNALRLVFGTRLISRKPQGKDIDDSQTGFGRKDEFAKAVVWLHNNKPDLLYRNLHLIPVFGCWKDLLHPALIATLKSEEVYQLVFANLSDQLLLKYLPQIRTSSKIRSERDRARVLWAKGFCRYAGITERDYRKLKSKGAAHVWQRQMTDGKWDQINFNGIPGRAMLYSIGRNGKDGKSMFERHGQVERLREWVKTQKLIKFTGYPYELTQKIVASTSNIQNMIYDRQFATCVSAFEGHNLGNVLCAVDTSESMSWSDLGKGVKPLDVCLSLGVVFSSLNVGYFKDVVCGFADDSWLIKLKGDYVAKTKQLFGGQCAMGSTNFQSVIDLLVKTRKKNPEIPVNEYPETLLVVSDMQFNPAESSYNAWQQHTTLRDMVANSEKTNYEMAMKKLRSVGLGDMRIIWWNVTDRISDFPATMDDKGTYIIGGYDPNVLKALMGLTPKVKDFVAKDKVDETPMDGLLNFLSQPIFELLRND